MHRQSFFRGLSRNTFRLAFASLFADISTEMLYPVLPVFLTQTLHATGSIVGLVDGSGYGVNFLSGRVSFSYVGQKKYPARLVRHLPRRLSRLCADTKHLACGCPVRLLWTLSRDRSSREHMRLISARRNWPY